MSTYKRCVCVYVLCSLNVVVLKKNSLLSVSRLLSLFFTSSFFASRAMDFWWWYSVLVLLFLFLLFLSLTLSSFVARARKRSGSSCGQK